jgi:hypothetical protein
MTTSFNPKRVAQDIAKGAVYLNPVTMKRLTADDLKVLRSQLLVVQRETRATQIPQENQIEINVKNRQLQYLQQAVTMLNGYAKKYRLRL